MAQTRTERIINSLEPEIVRVVTARLTLLKNEKHDVAIAWKNTQDVVAEEISKLLLDHLPDSKITSPTSKSTYPDIKIENDEGTFAIDIKVNENSKQPWFDMARIDTMYEERLAKYIEEWELVIKFDSKTGDFIKAYFLLFREAVGIRHDCSGIKFRPYDGKVRPKSWEDFDNNVIHWNTKKKFLNGIEKSLKFRWKENIKNHLLPKLSKDEIEDFIKLFESESRSRQK